MQRRSFFAATAAALLAPAARSAGAPLRVGQIGMAHPHAAGKLAALRSLPELWQVAGLAETDAALRAKLEKGAPYAGLPIFSEADLLAQPGLRAVAVETRLEQACATARRCLQAGLHVHLDKPGAVDHAEFRAMRLEAEQRGLTVQMGYMLRYNPAFELLFRAVREGWLGEITEIDAAMGKLADAGTRAAIGNTPGGGLFELACHVIDAIVTVLGKPASVAGFSTPTRDDGVPDNQMAVLQYARATAVVRCNHADPFGGPRRRFTDPIEEDDLLALWERESNREIVRACVKKISELAIDLSPTDRRKLREIYFATKETESVADSVKDKMMGDAARSLGRYISSVGASGLLDKEVLTTHIDAMHTLGVLGSRQLAERESLIAGLQKVVDKKLARARAA